MYMGDLHRIDACRSPVSALLPGNLSQVNTPLQWREWDSSLATHPDQQFRACSGKNHIFTEQPTSAAQQADYHLSPSSLSTIGVIPLNSLSISSSIPSSITCSRTNNYIMHFSYSSVFGQFLYACLSSSSNQITHILTPCIAHSAYK